MVWFLYLVSITWIATGACAILYTSGLRRLARRVLQDANPTLLGVVPIIGGMLLILSISVTTHPWVVGAIGVMGMLKGVLMVYNPSDWYSQTTRWYLDEISDQTQRLFGIIMVVFGTAMLSWVKQ